MLSAILTCICGCVRKSLYRAALFYNRCFTGEIGKHHKCLWSGGRAESRPSSCSLIVYSRSTIECSDFTGSWDIVLMDRFIYTLRCRENSLSEARSRWQPAQASITLLLLETTGKTYMSRRNASTSVVSGQSGRTPLLHEDFELAPKSRSQWSVH